ncbi:MAG: terminase small subunit [Bacilli bacterium]|nr:terminase small subunit [Bacilli bacterium]
MSLTPKQERFIQNIVSGMSQRQAYKEAFGAEYDDDAIDSNASTLFNSTKIQQRYKEIINKLEEETIMTAKQRMKWLSDVINGNIKEKTAILKTDADGNSKLVEQEFPSKLDTKIKALDTLNKMDGEYITKIEGEIGVTTIRVNIEDEE